MGIALTERSDVWHMAYTQNNQEAVEGHNIALLDDGLLDPRAQPWVVSEEDEGEIGGMMLLWLPPKLTPS